MNLRELINTKLTRIKDTKDLQVGEASEILVELSALMGNINEEIKNRSDEYNRKLLDIVEQPKMSVAKAQIIIKTTPEWSNLETAKGYKEAMLESCRSIKYFIKCRDSEFEVSRNL
jgi:hypothetical protein